MKFTFRSGAPRAWLTVFTFLSCRWVFVKTAVDGNCTTYNASIWPFNVETVKLPAGYQSPININTKTIKFLNMPPIDTKSYQQIGQQQKITCTNTGKTVECSFKNTADLPYVEGGPLTGKYVFNNVHWHWGRLNPSGSEHLLNKKTYATEVHLVHFKERYGNMVEAKRHQDGLCVLGFFGEIGPDDNKDLQIFFHDLLNISMANCSIQRPWHETYHLLSQLLKNNQDWITYPGSLTTPPFPEVVTWVLFPKPVFKVSAHQMSQFRLLQNPIGRFNKAYRRRPGAINKRPLLSPIHMKDRPIL